MSKVQDEKQVKLNDDVDSNEFDPNKPPTDFSEHAMTIAWRKLTYWWGSALTLFSLVILLYTIAQQWNNPPWSQTHSHPLFEIVVFFFMLTWIALLEGCQISIVGLQGINVEQYRHSHPRAYAALKVVHAGPNVERFLVGRQFLLLFNGFLMSKVSGAADQGHNFYIGDWEWSAEATQFFWLNSVLLMVVIISLGQLPTQLLAADKMLGFFDLHYYALYTVVYPCLFVESIGLTHSSYLLKDLCCIIGRIDRSTEDPAKAMKKGVLYYLRCFISVCAVIFSFTFIVKGLALRQTAATDGVGWYKLPGGPNVHGAAVDSDTAGAAAAQPHESERGGRGGPAVRFAEGTVYSRELDNRRWRASASSRAAPQWTKQYFADCVTCDICPVRAVAAFLAVGGVSVYERQSQARLVLAGKAPWPEESAMTAVLEMADALTPVALELQDTLVHDITELGQAEAIPIAEQHFVFAAVNAKARVASEGQNGEGGETAAAAALAPTAAASPVPDDKLQGFVTQTLTRLELEAQPNEDALGYDTSDGWFVLDEQLDLVSPDPSASSGGAGARRSPRDDGLDVDDSMYQSALELDASTLSAASDDGSDAGTPLDGIDPTRLEDSSLLDLSSVYFDTEAPSSPPLPATVTVGVTPSPVNTPTSPIAVPPRPHPKAKIQAEIKLLEEIMRKNKES